MEPFGSTTFCNSLECGGSRCRGCPVVKRQQSEIVCVTIFVDKNKFSLALLRIIDYGKIPALIELYFRLAFPRPIMQVKSTVHLLLLNIADNSKKRISPDDKQELVAS